MGTPTAIAALTVDDAINANMDVGMRAARGTGDAEMVGGKLRIQTMVVVNTAEEAPMTEAEERARQLRQGACPHSQQPPGYEAIYCDQCVTETIQQAISQAEARTLAAVAEELNKRASVALMVGEVQESYLLEGMAKMVLTLQPFSTALRKLLRDVAELVREAAVKEVEHAVQVNESACRIVHEGFLGQNPWTAEDNQLFKDLANECKSLAAVLSALDLDRILEEALSGSDSGGKRE